MNIHSRDGRETWRRLLEWDKGQTPAERMAGQVLRFEGFCGIDPSHPLGGPDGLKDIVCTRGEKKWIGAAYFPRRQRTFSEISKKFAHDLEGVSVNGVDGLIFVTNQELTLGERTDLSERAHTCSVEILHLERLASVLDSPQCYGLRLEYLDIDMTKEEQLAFIAQRDLILSDMKKTIDAMMTMISTKKMTGEKNAVAEIPTVTPTVLGDNSYMTTSIFAPKPHECTSCHAVFLVDRRPQWTAVSSMLNSMTVVTCPYCGRTERFHGLW